MVICKRNIYSQQILQAFQRIQVAYRHTVLTAHPGKLASNALASDLSSYLKNIPS